MTDGMEKRFATEIRAEKRGDATRLVGYAARYGVVADIGRFRERIAPGAFAASIASGHDVVALVDHNPGRVLGRTRSKTLKLKEETIGLFFDIAVPNTTTGRDTLALAERGDLGGASIGFVVEEEEREGGVRVVKRASLHEMSIVSAWPAYAETWVEARRLGLMSPFSPPRLGRLKRFLETV